MQPSIRNDDNCDFTPIVLEQLQTFKQFMYPVYTELCRLAASIVAEIDEGRSLRQLRRSADQDARHIYDIIKKLVPDARPSDRISYDVLWPDDPRDYTAVVAYRRRRSWFFFKPYYTFIWFGMVQRPTS